MRDTRIRARIASFTQRDAEGAGTLVRLRRNLDPGGAPCAGTTILAPPPACTAPLVQEHMVTTVDGLAQAGLLPARAHTDSNTARDSGGPSHVTEFVLSQCTGACARSGLGDATGRAAGTQQQKYPRAGGRGNDAGGRLSRVRRRRSELPLLSAPGRTRLPSTRIPLPGHGQMSRLPVRVRPRRRSGCAGPSYIRPARRGDLEARDDLNILSYTARRPDRFDLQQQEYWVRLVLCPGPMYDAAGGGGDFVGEPRRAAQTGWALQGRRDWRAACLQRPPWASTARCSCATCAPKLAPEPRARLIVEYRRHGVVARSAAGGIRPLRRDRIEISEQPSRYRGPASPLLDPDIR